MAGFFFIEGPIQKWTHVWQRLAGKSTAPHETISATSETMIMGYSTLQTVYCSRPVAGQGAQWGVGILYYERRVCTSTTRRSCRGWQDVAARIRGRVVRHKQRQCIEKEAHVHCGESKQYSCARLLCGTVQYELCDLLRASCLIVEVMEKIPSSSHIVVEEKVTAQLNLTSTRT